MNNDLASNFITLHHKKIKYFLRSTDLDYWPYVEVIIAKVYEPFKFKKTDLVLDVGANIGLFTLQAANKVKKIVSIEPEKSNFSTLKKNVRKNNFDNVILINMAVTDKKGILKIEGTSALAKISEKGIPVESDTLDSILDKLGIESVDVIKMDIEGYEFKVLKNFKHLETVREIIVETHGESNRKEVSEILEKEGFQIFDVSDFNYKEIIKGILIHPYSFFIGEWKNKFVLSKLCLKFILGIGPKPGHLSKKAQISLLYGSRLLINRR